MKVLAHCVVNSFPTSYCQREPQCSTLHLNFLANSDRLSQIWVRRLTRSAARESCWYSLPFLVSVSAPVQHRCLTQSVTRAGLAIPR